MIVKILGYCSIMLVGITVLVVWYVRDARKMKEHNKQEQRNKAAP